MLELAILGLLKERSMHGYQLSKRLTDTLGAFWKVSYGSLYPALKRLEKEGAVEPVFDPDDVGRRKNVYRITAKGEALFAELLQEAAPESWEDNRFRVRLAFFRYLKPDTRLRLLEKRRAYLEDRLSEIKTSLKNYRERIDGYTLSLMRHGADSTVQDIAWLDGLIETERRQVRADAEIAASSPPSSSSEAAGSPTADAGNAAGSQASAEEPPPAPGRKPRARRRAATKTRSKTTTTSNGERPRAGTQRRSAPTVRAKERAT
jgi:DNA-binding PadR family transcriptional regulator